MFVGAGLGTTGPTTPTISRQPNCSLTHCIQGSANFGCGNATNSFSMCFEEAVRHCIPVIRLIIDDIQTMSDVLAEKLRDIQERAANLVHSGNMTVIQTLQNNTNIVLDEINNTIMLILPELPSLPHVEVSRNIFNKLFDRAQELIGDAVEEAPEALLQIAVDCLQKSLDSVLGDLLDDMQSNVPAVRAALDRGGDGHCTITTNESSKLAINLMSSSN